MHTIQVRLILSVDCYVLWTTTQLINCIFEFKLEFEEEHLKLLGILTNLSFAGSGAHFDLSFQEKTQFEERVPVLFRLMHSTKSDKFCML